MKKYDANKLPNYALAVLIFVPLIFLMILGIASIASSSLNNALTKGAYIGLYLAQRQIVFACIGVASMLILTFIIPYTFFQRYDIVATLYFGLVAALTYVVFFAPAVKGARRWIRLGPVNIQPSEFGKIVFVILAAKLFSEMEKHEVSVGFRELKRYMPKIGLILVIPFLVMLGKDMGTVLHYFIVFFAMLFVSKIKFKYILVSMIIGAVIVSTTLVVQYQSNNFRSRRIKEFIDGRRENGYGGGYQTKQSVIGIGNGGLLGQGYGNGIQKYSYVPEIHTDFIFSTISEEFGFLVSFLIFLAYVSIFYSGITIAIRSRNCFAKFLATGIIFMIASQALINLYVVSGLIPVTGIPLPFISYGGSSIVSLMTSTGLLLSIVKYSNDQQQNKTIYQSQKNQITMPKSQFMEADFNGDNTELEIKINR